MKRKRYTEEQINPILMRYEDGAAMPEFAHRHGVAKNTIFR